MRDEFLSAARLAVLLTTTVTGAPGSSLAEQPLSPFDAGGRSVAATEVELTLDVAGGRSKCYLYGPPDPTNWNHLWSLRPVGDAVMFVSRVDGMALDANGGKGNPYPRVADPSNINHLWILARVGEDCMIWSKVTNVVLDANGGRGLPYLSANPDPRSVNHLWTLRKVGDDYMIVSKVRRSVAVGQVKDNDLRWEVGQPVPSIQALGLDGNPLLPEHLRGKTVLLTFWSTNDAGCDRHLELLRGLRQEFLHSERFLMISLCVDKYDEWENWLQFLSRQRSLEDHFPMRAFSSDARWWQMFHGPAVEGQQNPHPAGALPQSYLIGPDSRLLAVRVPDEKLRDVLSKAIGVESSRRR